MIELDARRPRGHGIPEYERKALVTSETTTRRKLLAEFDARRPRGHGIRTLVPCSPTRRSR